MTPRPGATFTGYTAAVVYNGEPLELLLYLDDEGTLGWVNDRYNVGCFSYDLPHAERVVVEQVLLWQAVAAPGSGTETREP